MRSLVLQAARFLIVATAAFSQKSAVSASAREVSQKDEQQIRQLEAEMLKGEMNSGPAVFENILADDCLMLPAGLNFTKAKLVEGGGSQVSRAGSSLHRKRRRLARVRGG
jgi:hypothetical protein